MENISATQRITGMVLDRYTQKPICDAHVCFKFKGLRMRAQTGESGTFEVNLPKSVRKAGLFISKSGFYPRDIINCTIAPRDNLFYITRTE